MITVGAIIFTIEKHGGSLVLDGERIGVTPADTITENEYLILREHKPQILNFLRWLYGDTPVLEYAADVLGFEEGPTADNLIDQAARLGVSLFVRPQGDVGILHGERVPDSLLRHVILARQRILTALRPRGYSTLSGSHVDRLATQSAMPLLQI